MAKSKTPKKQPRWHGAKAKEYRAKLAILKNAGIYKGDVRKAKGSGHQRELLKKHADVIEGKAKVVKVGRDARKFSEHMRAGRGRVKIQATKSERPRYDKKRGVITSTRQAYGERVTRVILPQKIFRLQDLPSAPRGKVYYYKVPFNGWTHSPRFQDKNDLASFMHGYAKTFSNWLQYVEIESVNARDVDEDFDDDMEGGYA